MNQIEYKKMRNKKMNRQAKFDSWECKADSYGIMSSTDMNRTQALISAYIVSGRGNLAINKVTILK